MTEFSLEWLDLTGLVADIGQHPAPFRFAAADFAMGQKLIDITDASERSTEFRATLTLTPQ